MPIRVQNNLPAKEILENENIFVMAEERAMSQDIRSLQVCILNLMPVKQDTELQILRAFSNTPLQVDVTFLTVKSHTSQNTSANHLNTFYVTMDEIRDRNFDGCGAHKKYRQTRAPEAPSDWIPDGHRRRTASLAVHVWTGRSDDTAPPGSPSRCAAYWSHGFSSSP